MNGTQAANEMMKMIAEDRKLAAIKAICQLDISIRDDYRTGTSVYSIGFWDAKLFVETVQSHMDKLKPDPYEVELSQYKKLRDAGFSMAEAYHIVESLK